MKYTRLSTRVTSEQMQILQARARANGFNRVSEYVRYFLFTSMTVEEKVDQIFKKVCKDE